MRHVVMTCSDHPHLRWMTKEIAWSGYYNGQRNIFYLGTPKPNAKDAFDCTVIEGECECSPAKLVLVSE